MRNCWRAMTSLPERPRTRVRTCPEFAGMAGVAVVGAGIAGVVAAGEQDSFIAAAVAGPTTPTGAIPWSLCHCLTATCVRVPK